MTGNGDVLAPQEPPDVLSGFDAGRRAAFTAIADALIP
jgi:hypothetical protein